MLNTFRVGGGGAKRGNGGWAKDNRDENRLSKRQESSSSRELYPDRNNIPRLYYYVLKRSKIGASHLARLS